jgi:hypothetical protein
MKEGRYDDEARHQVCVWQDKNRTSESEVEEGKLGAMALKSANGRQKTKECCVL